MYFKQVNNEFLAFFDFFALLFNRYKCEESCLDNLDVARATKFQFPGLARSHAAKFELKKLKKLINILFPYIIFAYEKCKRQKKLIFLMRTFSYYLCLSCLAQILG
jgi:hypothetical protein